MPFLSISRFMPYTAAFAFIFFPLSVFSQTVHFIVAADTNDLAIGPGVKQNVSTIEGFATNLATHTGIAVKLIEKPVQGNNFSCTSILNSVKSIKNFVTANDVVVFYYSGHGYADASSGAPYPAFDCRRFLTNPTTTDHNDSNADLMQIAAILEQMTPRPRMIIVIADACNSPPYESSAVAPYVTQQAGVVDIGAGFKRLFLGYQGNLVGSSSVPGEPSVYLVLGATKGGFFTNNFFSVIADELLQKGGDSSWEDIIAHGFKPIVVAVPAPQGAVCDNPAAPVQCEHPQYTNNLSSVAPAPQQ